MKPGEEPAMSVMFIRGEQWVKIDPSDNWIQLGIAPRPRNEWQNFTHHICHGIIMQYPLLDVIVWSWKNRRSFLD